jgi:hypothetical protein
MKEESGEQYAGGGRGGGCGQYWAARRGIWRGGCIAGAGVRIGWGGWGGRLVGLRGKGGERGLGEAGGGRGSEEGFGSREDWTELDAWGKRGGVGQCERGTAGPQQTLLRDHPLPSLTHFFPCCGQARLRKFVRW